MAEWIKSVVEGFSYAGIVFLMFLENVFPPLPSELIMPLAGFVSVNGELSFAGVIAAGTAGSVLGAIPLYYVGKLVGETRLRQWLDRRGKWLGLSGEDLDKSKEWFARHGSKTVLLCRLVPGVRSLISVPAGLAGMNLPLFLAYTTLGSAVWTAALAWAGRVLGNNYEKVEGWIGPAGYVAFGALAVWIVVTVVKRRRKAHA